MTSKNHEPSETRKSAAYKPDHQPERPASTDKLTSVPARSRLDHLTADEVLRLQRTYGNQSVQRMLAQAKPETPRITTIPASAPPIQRVSDVGQTINFQVKSVSPTISSALVVTKNGNVNLGQEARRTVILPSPPWFDGDADNDMPWYEVNETKEVGLDDDITVTMSDDPFLSFNYSVLNANGGTLKLVSTTGSDTFTAWVTAFCPATKERIDLYQIQWEVTYDAIVNSSGILVPTSGKSQVTQAGAVATIGTYQFTKVGKNSSFSESRTGAGWTSAGPAFKPATVNKGRGGFTLGSSRLTTNSSNTGNTDTSNLNPPLKKD